MTQQDQLNQLIAQMEAKAGKLPLTKTAPDIVPPEGNPQAQVMFIGEAAGYHESVERRPFVGAAGKLLTQSLSDIGLNRHDVWISNLLKCRPPHNRDPLPEEIEAYRPYLDQEISIIQPKIIVTLGRFSLAKFLPDSRISQVHGQARFITWQDKKIVLLPTYHPAAALRSTEVLRQFKLDFAKLTQILATLNQQPVAPEPSLGDNKPTSRQLTLI